MGQESWHNLVGSSAYSLIRRQSGVGWGCGFIYCLTGERSFLVSVQLRTAPSDPDHWAFLVRLILTICFLPPLFLVSSAFCLLYSLILIFSFVKEIFSHVVFLHIEKLPHPWLLPFLSTSTSFTPTALTHKVMVKCNESMRTKQWAQADLWVNIVWISVHAHGFNWVQFW